MRDFTQSIAIAAAPSRVWNILADVERWADWTPTVRRIERLEPAPLGVGSRVRIEQPDLQPAVWTISAWKEETGFTWMSRNRGFVATALHAVMPSGAGSRVTLKIRLDGLLASVAGVLAGGLIHDYLELEATGLKARCERGNARGYVPLKP
jgi:carbon monoxide dehydrogenase subunit G